ncbi:MAG: hypothetical protein VW378_05790 [bacterium]
MAFRWRSVPKRKHSSLFRLKWLLFLSVTVLLFLYGPSLYDRTLALKDRLFPSFDIPAEVASKSFSNDPQRFWLDNGIYFVLTLKETPLYYQANPRFVQKKRLPPLTRVKVIEAKTLSQIAPTDDIFPWVFVCDVQDQPLGWVNKENLAYKTYFDVTTPWHWGSFFLESKDEKADFTMHPKGYFRIKWRADSQGIRLSALQKGRFYEYGNLYWAKVWAPYPAHYFFYMKNDAFHPEAVNKGFRIRFTDF